MEGDRDNVLTEFPDGFRVLLVDDDRVSLAILGRKLMASNYKVTRQRATEALEMLRNNKDEFNLVLTDLHLPGMNGLELLQIIRSETDVPVVMISSDETDNVIAKAIRNGACDYLVKPIDMENLRYMWKHVMREKRNKMKELERMKIEEESQKKNLELKEEDSPKSEKENIENNRGSNFYGHFTTPKKARLIWTDDLHRIFLAAVNDSGGIPRALPKKILEQMKRMGVSDITRENIASHLQKFRCHHSKKGSELQSGGRSQSASLNVLRERTNSNQSSPMADRYSFTSSSIQLPYYAASTANHVPTLQRSLSATSENTFDMTSFVPTYEPTNQQIPTVTHTNPWINNQEYEVFGSPVDESGQVSLMQMSQIQYQPNWQPTVAVSSNNILNSETSVHTENPFDFLASNGAVCYPTADISGNRFPIWNESLYGTTSLVGEDYGTSNTNSLSIDQAANSSSEALHYAGANDWDLAFLHDNSIP